MGKQLRFYMVDQDENEFIEFVRSTGDVVILPQTSDREQGEEFSTFRELAGRRLGEDSHLWNRTLSPKPIVNNFPVHGGCYCLNFMQSEVVNVIRSKRTDETLSMGRLHIEDTVSRPDGSIGKKSAEFLKWFNELCKWIKKAYPTQFDGACLSARAATLAKSGIKLTGHRF